MPYNYSNTIYENYSMTPKTESLHLQLFEYLFHCLFTFEI